ncbi:hypothetical protein AB0K27_06980 [Micromonospora echinospora]|uniref:Uncharacterized protein n=1 Tax=Micromonospora echinospora TaxID=1877 RepID=A0ABR6M5T1_MICEC|nr:hypothetical protein [Micromonospora echinospora]MBB5110670.1 hypothetical protein [Micromonospora echinospora]
MATRSAIVVLDNAADNPQVEPLAAALLRADGRASSYPADRVGP